MDPYASMISNPCTSSLVPGIYGSSVGLLARLKSRITFSSQFNSNKNGYMLWFPQSACDRHTGGTTASGINFVNWGNNNPDAGPPLQQYGNINAATTAQSIADPAFPFVSSDTCQDFRVIAACLRITYTGTTSNASGMIYPLTNIPEHMVLYGDGGNTPPSMTNISRFANNGFRATDTLEVVYRPVNIPTWTDGNVAPLISGTTTTNAAYSGTQQYFGNTAIGFVILNGTALSDYVIEAYKIIEWRPEPVSGFSIPQQRGNDNPNRITKALEFLDRTDPQWQQQVVSSLGGVAKSMLRDTVLAGASMMMNSMRGPPQIMNGEF